MNYPKDVKEKLINLYDEALKLMQRLRTRDRIKQWLLSNGPPRSISKSLEDYLSTKLLNYRGGKK